MSRFQRIYFRALWKLFNRLPYNVVFFWDDIAWITTDIHWFRFQGLMTKLKQDFGKPSWVVRRRKVKKPFHYWLDYSQYIWK